MFQIDLHQITISGVSLPFWVIILLIVICLLLYGLNLCFKYFIKPWAEEKFKTIEKVGAMSGDLKQAIDDSHGIVKKMAEVKHAVTNLQQSVEGFGTRLALVEEKYDVFEEKHVKYEDKRERFEEDTKTRLTVIETVLDLKKK